MQPHPKQAVPPEPCIPPETCIPPERQMIIQPGATPRENYTERSQALKERYKFVTLCRGFQGLVSLGRCPGWIMPDFQASRCSRLLPMFPVVVRCGDGVGERTLAAARPDGNDPLERRK